MSKKEHHAVPNLGGGWDVKRNNAEHSSGHYETKQQTVDTERKISRNQGAKFIVHGKVESSTHIGIVSS